MTVMLNTGLREAEVIGLDVEHIDWNSGRLHVVEGKGMKDRILYLSKKDLQLLQEWKNTKPPGPVLFPTLKGTRLYPSYVRKMVHAMADKAGIKKNVYPHLLRHQFGSDLLRETGNLRLVQKALGHEDIKTTTIYTHIVDTELENTLKNFRKDEN